MLRKIKTLLPVKIYCAEGLSVCSIIVVFLSFLFLFNTRLIAQADSSEVEEAPAFVFPHSVNRLFTAPTSRVMNSLDVSVLLGGSFGFAENTGFLGTLALGIGGYGDIELSSESLLGSMFSSNESFSNVGMRLKIFTEDQKIPGVSIGIKANNAWNPSRNSSSLIRTTAEGLYGMGVREVNYDSRTTSLFLAVSKKLAAQLTGHAGINYADLRYKNVYTIFNESSIYTQEGQLRSEVWNFFGGAEYQLNDRTILMLEVQSFPYLRVSAADGSLTPARRVLTVVGLRFFVSKWLLVDSGIRYQDNYSGLADAEIRIGLNGIWNAGF